MAFLGFNRIVPITNISITTGSTTLSKNPALFPLFIIILHVNEYNKVMKYTLKQRKE